MRVIQSNHRLTTANSLRVVSKSVACDGRGKRASGCATQAPRIQPNHPGMSTSPLDTVCSLRLLRMHAAHHSKKIRLTASSAIQAQRSPPARPGLASLSITRVLMRNVATTNVPTTSHTRSKRSRIRQLGHLSRVGQSTSMIARNGSEHPHPGQRPEHPSSEQWLPVSCKVIPETALLSITTWHRRRSARWR